MLVVGRIPLFKSRADSQFLNTPGLDFSDAEVSKPAQEFDIVPNREGVEYAVRYVNLHSTASYLSSSRASKFANVRTIQLFFPHNTDNADGGEGDQETTRVAYVGLRGSWTAVRAVGRLSNSDLTAVAKGTRRHPVRGASPADRSQSVGTWRRDGRQYWTRILNAMSCPRRHRLRCCIRRQARCWMSDIYIDLSPLCRLSRSIPLIPNLRVDGRRSEPALSANASSREGDLNRLRQVS